MKLKFKIWWNKLKSLKELKKKIKKEFDLKFNELNEKFLQYLKPILIILLLQKKS